MAIRPYQWDGMSYCKRKTRLIAEQSIENFFRSNKAVWFLTFTEPGRCAQHVALPDGTLAQVVGSEVYWTKTQAEQHFKPFEDWCRRRGIQHLAFWEKQKRGAWHPHVLVNKYCDVKVVREFMMARGWGIQMFFKRVQLGGSESVRGHGETVAPAPLARYLIKYLTKAHTCEPRKKFFTGARASVAGNLKFKWNPWTELPHSMLYFYGRSLFQQFYGRLPKFCDQRHVIELGYHEKEWWNIDPWFDP